MNKHPIQNLVTTLKVVHDAVRSVKIPGEIPDAEKTGVVAIWPQNGKYAIGFSLSWEITCLNGEVTWMTWGNSKTRESAESSVRREMPLCTVKYYDADPNPLCVCGCMRLDHSLMLERCAEKSHRCKEYRPGAAA